MAYQHLIWDFDGTLFDSYSHIARAMGQALAGFGVSAPLEEALAWTKRSIGEAVDHYAKLHGLGHDALLAAYRAFGSTLPDDSIVPFPCAREVLQAVTRNGRGMNFIVTHRGDSTWKYVERAGFAPLFQEIVTKTNGFATKPSGEANRYLLAKYGLNPRDVLAVGDREIDVLAAVDAGVDACLFVDSGKTPSPTGTRATHTITSLGQLLEFVGGE